MKTSTVNWSDVAASLDEVGFARLPQLLARSECESLRAMYEDDSRFRNRIEMERFRFGAGEYKYFSAPLPAIVQSLREELYAQLAPVANRWVARLKPSRYGTKDVAPRLKPSRGDAKDVARRLKPSPHDPQDVARRLQASVYPPKLDQFLDQCRRGGQTRPTPLLLKYESGGYNCLHQDIYGELAFPLQVVVLLSAPEAEFTGGEFLLVEQRPRAQSRGHAIRVEQGAGLVFAVRDRPVAGTRGDYRSVMRHGVSTVLSGRRMTLGIIFHDAK